ncbi:hypothetical protein DCD74_11285 [Lysobacter oculi]|uniref:Uncharacterized protein n=1 Tax=Solilutibacter oculi TaxID=2698682 RepID=A0A344J825_9GAMM|nr:hypothetical protein DCD74_11285 [Lysobacter oculi]
MPIDAAIDAGFDGAMRRQWHAWQRGDAVSLRFLVPSRKQFFPVPVQRVDTGGRCAAHDGIAHAPRHLVRFRHARRAIDSPHPASMLAGAQRNRHRA